MDVLLFICREDVLLLGLKKMCACPEKFAATMFKWKINENQCCSLANM